MEQRVLLVHADDQVGKLAVRTLAKLGVEVDVVSRGGDAIAALDAKPYTILVIDHAAGDGLLNIIAERSAKPVVIYASPAGRGESTPSVVNVLVRTPYEPAGLVGVILASVTGSTT